MSRLTRDGTAEPVSRDQILRRERGQGNIHFLCSADHVQDWQPYPVDPYSCYICDHTSIRTSIRRQEPAGTGPVVLKVALVVLPTQVQYMYNVCMVIAYSKSNGLATRV